MRLRVPWSDPTSWKARELKQWQTTAHCVQNLSFISSSRFSHAGPACRITDKNLASGSTVPTGPCNDGHFCARGSSLIKIDRNRLFVSGWLPFYVGHALICRNSVDFPYLISYLLTLNSYLLSPGTRSTHRSISKDRLILERRDANVITVVMPAKEELR